MIKRIMQVGLVILLLITSSIAVYALEAINQLQTEVAKINQQAAPKSNDALLSVGTGGDGTTPYTEFIGVYPQSTLYSTAGAPSLRFRDLHPDDPNKPRDFEIGFYRYGPTWYSRDFITEFWLGNGKGGILSIAGNDQGGGELNVRNPTDTDGIRVVFRDATRPTISTETGIPLHFSATQGLISDNPQTFEQGIALASAYAGQVMSGAWNHGSISVPTTAVAAHSLILITPLSQAKGQWWVSRQDAEQSFTVTSSADDEDMNFNWMIVNEAAN